MPYARRNRISVEEKGQMAARSTNVYHTEEGSPEPAICPGCTSFYLNKRWYDAVDRYLLEGHEPQREVTCPACRRMRDDVPEGVVTLSGQYLLEHEEEILNRIKNEAAKTRKKNPLARIMTIEQEADVMTIRTTNLKLAEKLGRDIYKAHRGTLRYQWTADEDFLRVYWDR